MPNNLECPINTGTNELIEQENYVVYEGEKINVYGIPFEHGPITPERVEEFKRNVEATGAYGIIGEYFPPDIEGPLINYLIDTVDILVPQDYKKSEELEQLILNAGLNAKVICLDPAHNETWTTIDGFLLELPFQVSILTAAATIFTLNLKQQLSRKGFLKTLAAGSIATTLLAAPSALTRSYEMSNDIPVNTKVNPQALRRLGVAGNIIELDKKLSSVAQEGDAKVNLALCYPPTHIQGIKDYLNNWTPEDQKAADYIRSISDYNVARIFSKDEMGRWKKQILRLG